MSDSTLPTVLKRKGSLSMDHNGSARKKNHTGVQSFVSAPTHESDLRLQHNTCLDDLRIAMELTKAQFVQLTLPLLDLARDRLNINLPYEQQNDDEWNNFVAEACEQEPLWRAKYENAWPITTYMWRYLHKSSSYGKRLTCSTEGLAFNSYHSYDENNSSDSRSCNTTQPFARKPPNQSQLRNISQCSLDDLREAIGFDPDKFNLMKKSLRKLTMKYLDIDAPFIGQSTGQQWRLLVEEACDIQPLFATKFEGAWPVSVYIDRYLTTRHLDRNKRQPKLTFRRQQKPALIRSNYAGGPARPAWLVKKSPLPYALAPSIPSQYPACISPGPMPLDQEKTSPASMKSMADILLQMRSPVVASHDTSAPVREFLCRLGDDLAPLLPVFVKKGIKDGVTLSEFKKLSSEHRAAFLMKELDEFQLFRLQVALTNHN